MITYTQKHFDNEFIVCVIDNIQFNHCTGIIYLDDCQINDLQIYGSSLMITLFNPTTINSIFVCNSYTKIENFGVNSIAKNNIITDDSILLIDGVQRMETK
jgi:hypothetical protein